MAAGDTDADRRRAKGGAERGASEGAPGGGAPDAPDRGSGATPGGTQPAVSDGTSGSASGAVPRRKGLFGVLRRRGREASGQGGEVPEARADAPGAPAGPDGTDSRDGAEAGRGSDPDAGRDAAGVGAGRSTGPGTDTGSGEAVPGEGPGSEPSAADRAATGGADMRKPDGTRVATGTGGAGGAVVWSAASGAATAVGDFLTQVIPRVRLLAARVVWIAGLVTALTLGVGALLVALRANTDNVLVAEVIRAAEWLDGPFADVFTFPDPARRALVNWGLAAVAYLIAGGVLTRLIRP